MLYSSVLTAIFVFSSTSYGAVVRGRQVPTVELQSSVLPSSASSINEATVRILAGRAPLPQIGAVAPAVPAGSQPRPDAEQQQQPSGQQSAQSQQENTGNTVVVPLSQPIDTPLDPNVILDNAQGIPPTPQQSTPDGGNLAASGPPISTPLQPAGVPAPAVNPPPAQPNGQGQPIPDAQTPSPAAPPAPGAQVPSPAAAPLPDATSAPAAAAPPAVAPPAVAPPAATTPAAAPPAAASPAQGGLGGLLAGLGVPGIGGATGAAPNAAGGAVPGLLAGTIPGLKSRNVVKW